MCLDEFIELFKLSDLTLENINEKDLSTIFSISMMAILFLF